MNPRRILSAVGYALVLVGFFLIPMPLLLPSLTPLPFWVAAVGCGLCLLGGRR